MPSKRYTVEQIVAKLRERVGHEGATRKRVQNGYVSPGKHGHARPLLEP